MLDEKTQIKFRIFDTRVDETGPGGGEEVFNGDAHGASGAIGQTTDIALRTE